MLEKFKESLQNRIEKNALRVPGMVWTDSSGVVHTEDVVFKRSFSGNRVMSFLFGDWTRINPPIDDKGKINIVNTFFGGRRNLVILLTFMVCLFMVYSWTTGILGVGKEYLDGNKYVILNYTTFNSFCSKVITSGDVYDARGSWNGTAFKNLNLTLSSSVVNNETNQST